MLKRIITNKGFTLIELMVALTIFGIFITFFVNTYLNLSTMIRETNTNRKVYIEARNLLDQIGQEARKKTIDYDCYNEDPEYKDLNCLNLTISGDKGFTNVLVLGSKKGERTFFRKNPDNAAQIQTLKEKFDSLTKTWKLETGFNNNGSARWKDLLGENINAKSLSFVINPIEDPAALIKKEKTPYHPRVTIFLSLEGKKISFDVQKTISTRVYE